MAVVRGALPVHDPSAIPAGPGFRVRVDAFEGNDALPMRDYVGTWEGDYRPRPGNSVGIESMRAEAAASADGWEIAVLRRRETFIVMNRDTADLMRLYKTRGSTVAGHAFNVRAEYRGVEMSGLRVARAWHGRIGEGRWSGGLAVSLLQARRGRDGNVAGSFEALGAGNYRYRMAYAEAWHDRTFPFQPPGTARATGYATDLGLAWEHEGRRVYAIANDVLGRLAWRDLPSTVASLANAGLTTTDANGYIDFQPAMSGRNALLGPRWRLPVRWSIGGSADWGRLTAHASLTGQRGEYFPTLGLGWTCSADMAVLADVDTRFGTVGARLRWGTLDIGARTEARHPGTPRAYGFHAAFGVRF